MKTPNLDAQRNLATLDAPPPSTKNVARFERFEDAVDIYNANKAQYPKGQMLMFRFGDFFELLYDDAERFCAAFDRTLTRRGDVPITGVPSHAVLHYTTRLRELGVTVVHFESPNDPWVFKPLREPSDAPDA